MKILHCLNSPKIGGIERLVIDLVIEQKSKGLDVSIMLDSIDGEYYDTIIQNKIEIICSGVDGGFEMRPKKIFELKKIFRRFDIVHFHHFSLIKSLISVNHRKVVYTIHGLSKGVREENLVKYIFRETLKSFFLNRVNFFVANSEFTLNLAKRHYGLNKINKTVIMNGVKIPDNSNFSQSYNACRNIFTVGLVARFIRRKRIDRLIVAFKHFLDLGGEGKLILVGDGEIIENLKDLTLHLGISSYVSFTGYEINVSKYYKLFDVCVVSSENEPFGLVGVESYFNGKPVIAFEDSGGLKEVVKPLEPQNIVADEMELSNRILYYYKNRELSSDLAEDRIIYAQKNFSMQRMERDYFKVYNSVIGQK